MSEFNNVSLIREANIYFDGKVTSRTVLFEDGTKKTLGLMLPGEYQFDTDEREFIEVLGGEMQVQLPGEDWKTYAVGQIYEVPPHSSFKLKIDGVADYCCSYQ